LLVVFRCPACAGQTLFRTEEAGPSPSLICTTCGSTHEACDLESPDQSDRQHLPGAVEFSSQARRDLRRPVSRDAGFVDLPLDEPGSTRPRASLVDISRAGLTLAMDIDPGLQVGATLDTVTVGIEGRMIEGDLTVMNVRKDGDSGVVLGCLFYPLTREAETTWASLFPGTGAHESTAPLLEIRCGSCHSTIRVARDPGTDDGPVVVTCDTCSQEYALNLDGIISRHEEVRADARVIARLNRIDLPAAYSVLLGIMTLVQVRDMYELGRAPDAPEAGAASSSPYDPGFGEAVDAGWLTAGQAALRGERAAFVDRLVERHRLSRPLALAVADNRLSLLTALRQQGRRERIHVAAPTTTHRWRPATVTLVTILLVLLAAVGAYQGGLALNRAQEEEERIAAVDRQRQTIKATRIAKDESGRVIEISGPDPTSVLLAYCLRDQCEPLETAAPVAAPAGVRLGIFTTHDGLGPRSAIRIQRRNGAHDWVVGDGSNPIAVAEAPDLPPGTARFPLR
jgi:hypothetical protein